MGDIAYQSKDITAKVMADALKGKSLAPFGLPHLTILDILPTNLPAIESNELRLDHLLLLSDFSIGIIDYESSFRRENFIKYLNYLARVLKRYAVNRELRKPKRIKVIIIYTADVEQAEEVYDLGGLILTVESAYLIHMNTDEIYYKLKKKIETGCRLSDEEVMQLMVLPLTVKGKTGKQAAIKGAVELAKKLPDREAQIRALSGILTFTDKVIDPKYSKWLKEEMQMTQVGQMLIEEGLKEGIQAFIQDKVEDGIAKEQVVKKLVKSFGLSPEKAAWYYDKYTFIDQAGGLTT